jgi:hypothetical protein
VQHHVDPLILRDPAATYAADDHIHHVAEYRVRRRQERRRARARWAEEHPTLRIFTIDRDEVRTQLAQHGH